jgi:ENTS family enterobactin (siderophore) exporter
MHTRLAPLRIAAFRRLLAAYFIGRTGDWFGEIALSVVVLHSGGSALTVALLWTASTFLPAPVGPVLASRLRRYPAASVVMVSRAVEGCIFAIVAVAAATRMPVEPLIVLAFCDGLLNLVASGLTKAGMVCVSRPAGLHKEANALLNAAFTISFAAGPALAGLVIAGVGAPAALAIDVVSFALAASVMIGVGPLDAPGDDTSAGRSRLRSGLGRLWGRPKLRYLLIADGLSSVFFALIIPVELVFITRTLTGSAAGYGLVLAAWGVGAVGGAALLLRFIRVEGGALVAVAFGAMVVAYLGMGTATSVGVVIAFSFVGGIGNGIEGGALMTLIQQHGDDHEQADLNCLTESLHTGGPGFGYLMGGLIAAAASPRATYIVAACGGAGALVAVGQAVWTAGRRAPPVGATA